MILFLNIALHMTFDVTAIMLNLCKVILGIRNKRFIWLSQTHPKKKQINCLVLHVSTNDASVVDFLSTDHICDKGSFKRDVTPKIVNFRHLPPLCHAFFLKISKNRLFWQVLSQNGRHLPPYSRDVTFEWPLRSANDSNKNRTKFLKLFATSPAFTRTWW